MTERPAIYRLRWYITFKAEIAPGLSVDDVSIGGTEHMTAADLKSSLNRREWPVGTIFEITRRGRPEKTVRCFIGQISAWQASKRKLPLGSLIDLPRSRRSALQIFESFIQHAFDFAKSRELLEIEVAAEIERLVIQTVFRKAADR